MLLHLDRLRESMIQADVPETYSVLLSGNKQLCHGPSSWLQSDAQHRTTSFLSMKTFTLPPLEQHHQIGSPIVMMIDSRETLPVDDSRLLSFTINITTTIIFPQCLPHLTSHDLRSFQVWILLISYFKPNIFIPGLYAEEHWPGYQGTISSPPSPCAPIWL